MSAEHACFDDLETRDPAARETALMARLADQIAHAKATARAYQKLLAEIEPREIVSRDALAGLPVTRKAALLQLQSEDPPFGGLAAYAEGALARVFASPGPIYEPQVERPDFWRCARAFHAAGFRRGELVHNAFAYHLTPGGWIMDDAARALGCAVIPAGTGNSEQQVQAIAHLRPTGFSGTPDFLKLLLDKADELGLDCSSITKALVSGGALFPSLRADYAARGVAVLQCYATADLGLIAYESSAQEGLIVDEDIVVEIVRPGTGDPLPEGEVGEVVVTLFNPDYPLIRFATGDLSAVLPGPSPCGRTNMRLKGWMGRADQSTKVKGMFVHPSQVAAVMRRHPEIGRARLVVARKDEADSMTLQCEVAGSAPGLTEAIAASLADSTKLKGEVELVAPSALPNDGKIIDDQRDYD
ncbi:MAG: AMP-binding protein [Kiloniellales bacterium]|nr:AMP-binding protein [Kiloniellales bacterium]